MNAKTSKKLKAIVDPIYKQFKPRLYKKVYAAPDIRQMNIDKAKDASLPDYERRRYQNLVDAGVFDAQEDVVEEEVSKEYEAAVEKAIDEAIKKKELPKPKTPAIMKKLIEKSQKHAKRKQEGGKSTKRG